MEIKNAPELFKKIKTAFSRLERRQKILILFFVFALFFSFSFNKLLKPQFKQLVRLKSELAEAERKATGLKMEMPDVAVEKVFLERLKAQSRQLQKYLVGLEKELPQSYHIAQLLGEFAKQAQGAEIDFSYIKPKSSSAALEDEYARLDIEMQLNAPYYDFYGYLGQLERLSAYLNINDIVIEEMKESDFAGKTLVTLILSTLLKKGLLVSESARSEIKEEALLIKDTPLERNPFLPASKGVKPSRKSKYVLSGITFAAEKSSAIINNEVYRIGDLLDKKYPVKQILPNMVIISCGRQTEILMLE